ncbi:MAG: haloacid dehalogenase [Nitrososphaerota archaeon]|nr:haloacid dehalogenase [Nitrososphaerota archaeon]
MSTLKAVLEEIKQDVMQKNKIREDTHEDMRKATSLSKQAILLIHQKKQIEAEKMVKCATEKIVNLQKLAKQHPDIIYCGMFSDALQEYAEANIFLTLIKENRFITPKEINVPPIEYTLGLADVVGEFRRLSLDTLREGNTERGEEYLKGMDEIFIELLALDEAYMLVPGLRRKTDVARKIIETTRGDITQEVRRKALEDYLRHFSQTQIEPIKSRKTKKVKKQSQQKHA